MPASVKEESQPPQVSLDQTKVSQSPEASGIDNETTEIAKTDSEIEGKVTGSKTHNALKTESNQVSVTEFVIGGRECVTFNDDQFSRVRRKFGIQTDFATDENSFNFKNLAAAGGKGGDPMAFTSDRRIIIKELNPGDNKELSKLTKPLADHACQQGQDSLLAPILIHFKFKSGGKRRFYAMLNCLNVSLIQESTDFLKVYDLKGCADDKLLRNNGEKVNEVHKRFYNIGLWLHCTSICFKDRARKRKEYFDGKLEALHHPYIPLESSQKQRLIAVLKRDVEFLKKYRLMDYSLLAGVSKTDTVISKEIASGELVAGSPIYNQDNGEGRAVVLSIIDYLQSWGAGKVVAKVIKSFERNRATVPPNMYGDRFVRHFDQFIVPIGAPEQQKKEKEEADKIMPYRCFPLSKK